jgi:L-ascorbate metabolism protein UlaG (beta-lactamase superfamily)
MLEHIQWLGHATFRIAGSKLIYIDPWKLSRREAADIILVSHSHSDHFSPADIEKLRGPRSLVITVPELKTKIAGAVRTMEPGDSLEIEGVRIEAIPAYNRDKKFHPRASGWLGFVITMDGQRLYYAGDTCATPEMAALEEIDVAFLPIGGTYTMNAHEAAAAADRFKPGVVIPYHWGDIIGTAEDAQAFAAAYAGRTAILTPQHPRN